MKKLLSILLVSVLIVTLFAACGSKDDTTTPAETTTDDGTILKATGEADERGWAPMIEITMVDGVITAVYYDEYHEENDVLKSEDTGYHERWFNHEERGGVQLLEAYAALEASLIEKQNVDDVDAYTGATSSYESFIEVAAMALATAE